MSTATAQRPGWLQLLSGFGVVLIFSGGIFLLDGAWQSYLDHVQRTKWPTLNARIDRCTIYETWSYGGTPNTKTTSRKDSYVRCKVLYEVAGTGRQNYVKVGDALSTYGEHQRFLTSQPTLDMMRDWIGRHPSGSLLRIHYDPSDPQNVSLAREDKDLKALTPFDRLWFGILVCGGGFVVVAIARQSRKYK